VVEVKKHVLKFDLDEKTFPPEMDQPKLTDWENFEIKEVNEKD